MAVFLAPDPIQSTQFIPGGSTPANGGQLFFYAAGSSTKQTVYKDSAGAVPHTNPIILDSGGNIPSGGEVWFTGGVTYKVIFAPSTDSDPPVSPYWTKDNLSGMNDTSVSQSEWVSGTTPTFVSATAFSLAGDQTATFTVGRRLKTTNTGGIVYCTIVSVSFAGVTTVNVTTDSGSLDAGLSAVSYGLLEPSNRSIDDYHIYRKGTAIASAGNSTTNIWQSVGDYVHITGTNSIRSFSSAPYAGSERTLIFDGALTVFSSASMVLPGNANISTSANDRMSVRAETVSTYVVTMYQPAAGYISAVNAASNTVYAGPTSGAATLPQFRLLTGLDGAGLIFLGASTIPANTSLVAIGTSQIANWAAYDEIQIKLTHLVPAVNTDGLVGQLSSTGTLNYITATYYSGFKAINGAGTNLDFGSSNANAARLGEIANGISNIASNGGYSGTITIYNPGTTNATIMKIQAAQANAAAGGVTTMDGAVIQQAANSPNGFKFFCPSGNISSGSYAVYGVQH